MISDKKQIERDVTKSEGSTMKRTHYITRPVKVSEMTFQDLYAEISDDWKQKAHRLQLRRQRALKRAMKPRTYSHR